MSQNTHKPASTFRRAALALIAAAALFIPAPMAAAKAPTSDTRENVIVLPNAAGAEGVAAGKGSTFYAGDLVRGSIFRGDIREGTAKLFIDVPDGRAAVGMKADVRNDLLFVAGGATGQAYVYDTEKATTKATFQLTTGAAFINDVALSPDGAWFTNSRAAELYFLPVGPNGTLGEVQTLKLSGPASDTSAAFNLNGIAAVRGGKTLIVAHSGNAALYTVNPTTGSSAVIAGLNLPSVDGIVVKGRTLWAVQNGNQISRIRLASDLSSGEVQQVITSELFNVTTTAALFGRTLAVVNAKFGVPGASTFEVVLVDARQ
jgi:streptogramin lyase